MRCKCCNEEMKDNEVEWNEDIGDWELCRICKRKALYPEDDFTEDELREWFYHGVPNNTGE